LQRYLLPFFFFFFKTYPASSLGLKKKNRFRIIRGCCVLSLQYTKDFLFSSCSNLISIYTAREEEKIKNIMGFQNFISFQSSEKGS